MRPTISRLGRCRCGFQSTHPLRGATGIFHHRALALLISIHAPLAGRDLTPDALSFAFLGISIHAPLAGRDPDHYFNAVAIRLFQSTRPLRGATYRSHIRFRSSIFQSTRPLRGATSLHRSKLLPLSHFNPRAPCGARPYRQYGQRELPISIHAPLAGRDETATPPARCRRYFNPRAPCGARL